MNLVTTSGLTLSVKNLAFQVNDAFSGHAFCSGFDSLVIAGKLAIDSISDLADLIPLPAYVEIVNALDNAAQTLADDELATALQDRHDYRVACHG